MTTRAATLIAVLCCLTLVGCSSPLSRKGSSLADAGEPGGSDPFQTASASRDMPVTFLDLPRLQSGTGPMDDAFSKEFKVTGSGLRYRILRRGDGRQPTARDAVTVNYRGWLDDGTEFDSSYKRGESTSFPLNGVIPGWTEGMQLVKENGMIELWVPPRMGYGKQGNGNVPPNATLHFVVELISVN